MVASADAERGAFAIGSASALKRAGEADAVKAPDQPTRRLVLRTEDKAGGDPLGFVALDDEAMATLTLHDVRQQLSSEWDAVPKGMVFLWEGVPIARKQEAKEMAAGFLPTLMVRLPAEATKEQGQGDDGTEDGEDKGEKKESEAEGESPDGEGAKDKLKVTDLSCKAFTVEEKVVELVNPCTAEKIKTRQVKVTVKSPSLVETLRRITKEERFFVADDLASSSSFKGVTFDASLVLDYKDELQEESYRNDSIPQLLRILEDEETLKELTSRYEKMLETGEISFRGLCFLFKKGTKVLGWEGPGDEWPLGMEVTECHYRQCFWSGPRFIMSGHVVDTDGRGFHHREHSFEISSFDKTKPISELPIRPLEEESEEMKSLVERGRLFRQVGMGSHYMSYSGNVLLKSWWCGFTQIKGAGRVMLDASSFQRYNPNYPGRSHYDSKTVVSTIPDDQLFSTWPTIKGFSFMAKKWGELVVSQLSNVKYDDMAFKQLVIPPEKKVLIKALVENNEESFQDIITGKGGGCIFLLHGPPGVGKTLTAEAIAELLHRPLYSVAVGELGTSTTSLEEKLREILELSSIWNAVLLIDEADIFLEKRTENDIQRNAMVGIFLRLLEYHQGVLFLTTNRIKAFDSAFHSRISIALKYDALGEDARAQVWSHLLQAAGLPVLEAGCQEGLSCQELATYQLNGRQIKNTIRLAQSLARSEGTILGSSHIQQTVDVAQQFQRDIGANEELTGHACAS